MAADLEANALQLSFQVGAYLWVFGSLITAPNPQTTQTNGQGGLTRSVLELFSKSQANALRA